MKQYQLDKWKLEISAIDNGGLCFTVKSNELIINDGTQIIVSDYLHSQLLFWQGTVLSDIANVVSNWLYSYDEEFAKLSQGWIADFFSDKNNLVYRRQNLDKNAN